MLLSRNSGFKLNKYFFQPKYHFKYKAKRVVILLISNNETEIRPQGDRFGGALPGIGGVELDYPLFNKTYFKIEKEFGICYLMYRFDIFIFSYYPLDAGLPCLNCP